ncbi:hypothetical protein [Rhodococcus sp. p52]|nr:hypothetical protein [Rhodococcus sp. p52]
MNPAYCWAGGAPLREVAVAMTPTVRVPGVIAPPAQGNLDLPGQLGVMA